MKDNRPHNINSENQKSEIRNQKIWQTVAYIAGAFSIIICILLIANYLQMKKVDPIEQHTLNLLIERLNENPDDEALREEIRTFDYISRKAYFTNTWQVRTGGYLLLIGIATVIISLQIISLKKKKEPLISDQKPESIILNQKKSRFWISVGGVVIVASALIAAFLTHSELEDKFTQKATLKDIQVVENEENITEDQDIDFAEEEITDTNVVDSSTTEKEVEIVKYKAASWSEIKHNFPSFRGPGGNGIAFQKNIPTKWDGATGQNIKWKLKIPLHGYSSPIVWGTKVFITGADENNRELYCIDINSGKILWTAKAKDIQGSPGKSPKTTDDTGLSAPTPTTDGTHVYAIFGNGDIIAVDMDGKQVWAKNLGMPVNHYGHSSSLIMHEDKLIVQYDQRKSSKVIALSGENGELIWSTERKVKISWASPVVINTGSKDEIILISDPLVSSYNPNTGKENWKVDCMTGEVGPSVAYANGIVFAMNEYASLVAIDVKTQEILWEDNEYLSEVPSPVAYEDFVIIPTAYGVVVCYDAKNGEMLWEQEFDNGFYSSPILVEGKVYMLDRKGIMHIFKASRTFELVSEAPLGVKSDCTPAFANGKILIRADEYLFCIGK
jgi:outer membrane protein assembly factor BamB